MVNCIKNASILIFPTLGNSFMTIGWIRNFYNSEEMQCKSNTSLMIGAAR